MRIYIPATNRDLLSAPIEPRVVHAVTRALEHALGPEDPEVVEAVAMNAAADAWARQGHARAADNYGILLFQTGRQTAAMPWPVE